MASAHIASACNEQSFKFSYYFEENSAATEKKTGKSCPQMSQRRWLGFWHGLSGKATGQPFPASGHSSGVSLHLETELWHSTHWLQFFLQLVRHTRRLIKLKATSWVSLPMPSFHRWDCGLDVGIYLAEAKMELEPNFLGPSTVLSLQCT